jgi:hypothetical protein
MIEFMNRSRLCDPQISRATAISARTFLVALFIACGIAIASPQSPKPEMVPIYTYSENNLIFLHDVYAKILNYKKFNSIFIDDANKSRVIIFGANNIFERHDFILSESEKFGLRDILRRYIALFSNHKLKGSPCLSLNIDLKTSPPREFLQLNLVMIDEARERDELLQCVVRLADNFR